MLYLKSAYYEQIMTFPALNSAAGGAELRNSNEMKSIQWPFFSGYGSIMLEPEIVRKQ